MKGLSIRNQQRIYFLLLFLTLAAVVLPSYAFVSQLLILTALYGLFFMEDFRTKRRRLRAHMVPFLMISLPFWLALLEVLFHPGPEAVSLLVRKLPFLIFPLLVFSGPYEKGTASLALRFLAWATVAVSLSALLTAWAVRWTGWGDYLFYHELSLFTRKHTTYFALFITTALYYFAGRCLSGGWRSFRREWTVWAACLILVYMLFLLSNRISFVALAVALAVRSLDYGRSAFLKAGLAVGMLLLVYWQTPYARSRWNYQHLAAKIQADLDKRTRAWQAVIQVWQQYGPWTGVGHGEGRQPLYVEYKEKGLIQAYLEKYNAHNQYLEMALSFGWIGGVLFWMSLAYMALVFIRRRHYEALGLLSLFLVFMLTESILERQSGIILFAALLSLLWRDAEASDHEKVG